MAKSKPIVAQCGTCKWWEAPNDNYRRYADRAARCVAPIADPPALPDSITRSYHWTWPPRGRNHQSRLQGTTCPCWEPWTPIAKIAAEQQE